MALADNTESQTIACPDISVVFIVTGDHGPVTTTSNSAVK